MGGKSKQLDAFQVIRLRATRRASLYVAIIIVAYAVLAEFSLVPRSDHYNPYLSFGIAVLFTVLAAWRVMLKSARVTSPFHLLLLSHALSAIAIIFVTGFMGPLTVAWVLLIMMSILFFSQVAVAASISSIYLVMALSLLLSAPVSAETVLQHMFYATIIVILGWYLNELRIAQVSEHSELVSTHHRELTQQNQLMTLINSLSQAIVSVSPSGIVQLYNAAALDLLDTNQSLNGKNIKEILHLVDAQKKPIHIIDELKKVTSSMQRDDLAHQLADGELVRLDIGSSIIYGQNNKRTGYLLILRDITKSKTLDEERDEFIAVISHELRTPITIAEGTVSNVEMLIEKGAKPSVVKKSITSAHDQIIYLSNMVNDLSTLSRAERGAGDDFELINLKELAEQLYNEYSPKAQESNLQLNIELPKSRVYIHTSRLYIEEIIQNFITNAIKYTDTGSVTLSISTKPNKSVSIAVSDTGIGMSKKDTKKVFEKFYRAEDYRTRETSGTGLGLYVVQKLAQKIGVHVQVESTLNKGSIFSLEIALASKELIENETND